MIAEILNPDGSVANTIVAEAAFLDNQHPGAWREVVAVPSLEGRRQARREAVREHRKVAEVGGTTLPSGIRIGTDETSQRKIAGAVALFEKDPTLDHIDFEASPGVWVTLDQRAMDAVGIVAGRHVQAVYSRARALDEALVAAPDEAALDAIDITTGWPGEEG